MEIKVNRIDSANADIEAIITVDILDKKIDEAAKKAAKTMKVDGFRKGKVPTAVVKRRYSEQLENDAQGELLRSIYDEGLKKLELNKDGVIGEPKVETFEKGEDKIDVKLLVGIKPEINLDDIDSLIPDFDKVEASEEEVEERLKELANSSAPFKKVEEDRAVVDGDYVSIDFDGSIDGEPIEGGKAENFSLHIGSKSFIDNFEEQVIGMKVNDSKTIKAKFPDDYRAENLAGKEAEFSVKLHEIKVKEEQEINDELAKKLLPGDEEADVAKLKEKIKEQIDSEKMSKTYNEELKPQTLEAFAQKITFEVPNFIVEQEMDLNLQNSLSGKSQEEIQALVSDEAKIKEEREKFREDALKSVKVTFIVDALSKKENVTVSDNELMQTIYYEAMQAGQDPKQLVEMYQQRGILPAIRMSMMEDKVLSKMLDKKMQEKQNKAE